MLSLDGSIGRNATIDNGEVDQSEDSTAWMNTFPWFNQYVDTIVEPGLRVSDTASIGGKVTYTSSIDDSNLLEGVTVGGVVYQTPVPYEESKPAKDYNGNVKSFQKRLPGGAIWGKALSVVRSFIKLFVLGALALWLLQKPFKKLVEAAYQQPMMAMGWGFVAIAIGFMAVFYRAVGFRHARYTGWLYKLGKPVICLVRISRSCSAAGWTAVLLHCFHNQQGAGSLHVWEVAHAGCFQTD